MVFVDAVSTLKTFVWVLNYVLRSRTCFLFILKANFPDPLMALAKTKVPKFPKLLNIADRNTLYIQPRKTGWRILLLHKILWNEKIPDFTHCYSYVVSVSQKVEVFKFGKPVLSTNGKLQCCDFRTLWRASVDSEIT